MELKAVNEIDCIQVSGIDSAYITLSSPFSSQLWTATSIDGPYSQIISPPTSNGGYTVELDNIDALTTPTFFYFFDPLSNEFSDTLSTIVLDVDPMNGGGIANVSWNLPFTPGYTPPLGSYFSLQREYPLGIWSEVAQLSISSIIYLDTISICEAFLNYRVECYLGTSCLSRSNIDGDLFNNNTPPDIPEIIQVGVDTASGFASITWNPPPQNDVQGYVIVQNINGFSVAIDTVWDANQTYYIDYNSDINTEVYTYGIAAFDTCINPNSNPPFYYISPPTALDDFHQTILLENEYFGCEQVNELSWNSYINWPSGVDHYELYVSQDNLPYQLLASFTPNDTNYTHENLNAFSTYCYLIKAIDNSGTRNSLSNELCQEIVYPGLPDVVYLSTAIVDSSLDVTLTIYLEASEDIEIQGFNVQAMYPNSDIYEDIGMVMYEGQNTLNFVDEDSQANIGTVWYRVQVIDGCGNNNFYSNEINTLFLNIVTDDYNALNTLVWNAAEGRAGEIVGYRIYRNHNEQFYELIYEAGAFEYFYQDDLSEEYQFEGDYCYFIESIEESNPFSDFEDSRSNEECAVFSPRVWIPNSFIVDGEPPTFGPVFAYANTEDYRMTILTRWGQVIYDTRDVYSGWDGYFNGNPVQQGVYVYIIELKDGLGKVITEKGSVTVFSHR